MLAGLLCARGARAQDDEACLACHADRVDAARFAASAHAALGCAGCHTDVGEFPHPEDVAPPACGTCHDDVETAYQAGVHGRTRARGATEAAGCPDCHGAIHAVVPHADPASPVHWSKVVGTCARCHADTALAQKFRIPVVRPVEAYLESTHARAVAAGRRGAVCSDCHGAHEVLPASDPRSPLWRTNVPDTCGKCHADVVADYRESVHGQALARGVSDAPVCTTCHGEHRILGPSDAASPVFAANVGRETCGRCHGDARLSEKYGLPAANVAAYQDSFHGLALRAGQLRVANCGSCHGVHDIRSSSDPRSHVNPKNLPRTCGKCHPGAGTHFALGPVHVDATSSGAGAVYWVRVVYLWLIALVIGAMAVHNGLDLLAKARRPRPPAGPVPPGAPERMPRTLRRQHAAVMSSFVVLVYSGFALTYPESWWAAPLLRWETTFPARAWLHRAAAIVLVLALAWHAVHLALDPRLRACLKGLWWSRRDAADLLGTLAYYLGRRATRPHGGTFTYVEKAEYWAFLWGTAVMAATGGVLWFENTALRYLPKWVTDVATAIHFWEAVLATLAIVIWHFYWVIFDPDVYPMDTSFLHGRPPAARAIEREGDGAPPRP